MLLFLDSANHYATAQIAGKYTTAPNATIVAAAGRLGGSALFFNNALPANVTKTLTPSAFGSGGNLFTLGFACRPLTIPGPNPMTLARLTMSAGLTVSLQLTATGQLQVVRSDTVGAIAISPAGTMVAGVGAYLEFQWNSNNGSGAGSAIVRVNTSVVCQTFFATLANTYTAFQFGPTGAETGTFYVSDVYVLDGNATSVVGGITRGDGTTTTLSDFLGNMSVQALVPTADGVNLAVANTPWAPAAGQATNFSQVNSRLPNDASLSQVNVAAAGGNRDAYTYQHPRAGTFQPDVTPWGFFSNGTPWPLYGVQLAARVKANIAGSPQVKRVARKIVTGQWAADTVSLGTGLGLAQSATVYLLDAMGGDPTNGNAAWNFSNLSLSADPTVAGSLELGMSKV